MLCHVAVVLRNRVKHLGRGMEHLTKYRKNLENRWKSLRRCGCAFGELR